KKGRKFPKIAVVSVILVALIAIVYTVTAYTQSWWPYSASESSNNQSSKSDVNLPIGEKSKTNIDSSKQQTPDSDNDSDKANIGVSITFNNVSDGNLE